MNYDLLVWADTREQKPLTFEGIDSVTHLGRRSLNFGDYSCECNGYTSNIVFERKSRADLWTTFGGDHSRFKREMSRASGAGKKLVLITECSVSRIKKGFTYCKGGVKKKVFMTGPSMIKKLETIRRRYGLEIVYCTNRNDAELYMYNRWLADFRESK